MFPHKSFYLVRHGQSEANAARIMCGGGLNTPLTELGHWQAQRAAKQALDLIPKPQAIISSTMQRAYDTALAIAQRLDMPIHEQRYALREHEVGAWEGLSYNQVLWLGNGNVVDPPEGETYTHFYKRVQNDMKKVLQHYTLPLVVAHGGVIWATLAGMGLVARNHAENACIYYFVPPDNQCTQWRVTTVGRDDVPPLV